MKECPLGYMGKQCNEKCPECKTKGENFFYDRCLKNGLCLCKPGWESALCDEKCTDNYFGQNCVQKCNCSAQFCHHVIGCQVATTSDINTNVPVVVQNGTVPPHPFIPKEGVAKHSLTAIAAVTSCLVFITFMSLFLLKKCQSRKKALGERTSEDHLMASTTSADSGYFVLEVNPASEYSEITDLVKSEGPSGVVSGKTECGYIQTAQTTKHSNAVYSEITYGDGKPQQGFHIDDTRKRGECDYDHLNRIPSSSEILSDTVYDKCNL